MNRRCHDSRSTGYADYGARGISVCDEWRHDFQTFREWAVANGYRDDLTIERKDVNGGYEPGNCTWADSQRQSENRRFVSVAPDGELWLHKALANGITKDAFYFRKRNGWPMEQAVTWPMGVKRYERPRDESGRFA